MPRRESAKNINKITDYNVFILQFGNYIKNSITTKNLCTIIGLKSLKSHDTPESQLRTFLPTGDDADDVDEVLAPLFGSGNFQFGNPVDKFKSDVEEGNLSPESQSVRRLFWKSERRNYKAKMKERAYTQLHDMLKARNGFITS